ncbi:claudin f [Syngnathus typhle]
MGKIGKETAGQIISFIGLVGVAVTTGIPMWRVTSFIGANIVTGQIVWDGLWMNCVMQSTGQMQCRLNESVMRLTPDLQAARALVIISLVFGFIGFMITFIGAKCTSCLKKDASMSKVVIIGGCLVIVAAVLVLIPVTWSATITITDFQNPLTINTQRREIGAAIYIGWGSAAILLVGGIILTTSCPPQTPTYGYPRYQAPYGSAYGSAYGNGSTTYAPVYAPTSSQPYAPSGSYYPSKPYVAPSGYEPRQYI